jgi:hypothetical protein
LNNSVDYRDAAFAFGLILYELFLGQPGFPLDFVNPDVRTLIRDCWAQDLNERPTVGNDLSRMDRIDFQITPGVKSLKVRRFANAVKAQEKILGIAIEDSD